MTLQFTQEAVRWPVLGHEMAERVLRRAITGGMLSHAYLFTGPSSVGKRTLALAFAMTLNCQAEPPEGQLYPDMPCGLCQSCSRIRRGEHPDVLETNLETQAAALEEAGKGKGVPPKELRIDTIRDMQHTVGLSPYMGRYKIYILGDADRLNEEAANCLLKTLEEPPRQTILLLLAPSESAVLPTISSRCIQVPLRPLSREAVAGALMERWSTERADAEKLAALAGGRLGWAVQMHSDPRRMERRGKVLEELALLSGSSIAERINAATRLAKQFTEARGELYNALEIWEGWWRDVLMLKAGADDLVMNVDQRSALKSVAKRVPVDRAHAAIGLIGEARQQLQENANPRLVLEALTLGIP